MILYKTNSMSKNSPPILQVYLIKYSYQCAKRKENWSHLCSFVPGKVNKQTTSQLVISFFHTAREYLFTSIYEGHQRNLIIFFFFKFSDSFWMLYLLDLSAAVDIAGYPTYFPHLDSRAAFIFLCLSLILPVSLTTPFFSSL